MRILIGITTCHKAIYPDILSRTAPPNNALCVAYSRSTWMLDAFAKSIDVKYFYGRGATRERQWDEVFLDCDDSYDGLVDKVTAMCAWAWDHGYDYFMKTDIDSYVHIDNLLKAMNGDFYGWDYAGRGWGLGYILSRKAMKIVADTKQRLSWAEDSHVLRTLFMWGEDQSPASIKLYGDGRFVFLPNLPDAEIPLYDKSFIVVNPMMPETMQMLQNEKRLTAIMPFPFVKEDLWVAGQDRVQHSRVLNAFVIKGEPFEVKYEDWVTMTPYNRQPYIDWTEVVNACAETRQIEHAPSFAVWMGPLDHRKEIQKWAKEQVSKAALRMQQASQLFKQNQGGL